MSQPATLSKSNRRLVADLRARIARLEGLAEPADATGAGASVALGIEAIDTALGGGLRRTGLHEVSAADESAAAAGFCALLLARLAGEYGFVVWCRREAGLYGPGLAEIGLDPSRLIVVRPRREDDVLWVLEEGLRSRALAAVLAETGGGGPIALRRLQLAAEGSGVAAILLRPFGASFVPGPAQSRWWIGSAMRGDVLGPRWRFELQRCRTGTPATWLVEWCDETGGFAVVPDLRDRPARPPAPAAAIRAAL